MTDEAVKESEQKPRVGDGTPGPGRPKGIPNKATTAVRDALAQLAEGNVGRVQEWLEQVDDPAKRVDLFLKLIEYCVPKLARAEVVGEGGGALTINLVRFGSQPPA